MDTAKGADNTLDTCVTLCSCYCFLETKFMDRSGSNGFYSMAKMSWSVAFGGQSGKAVFVPAMVGLAICVALIYIGFRRWKRDLSNKDFYQIGGFPDENSLSNQKYH